MVSWYRPPTSVQTWLPVFTAVRRWSEAVFGRLRIQRPRGRRWLARGVVLNDESGFSQQAGKDDKVFSRVWRDCLGDQVCNSQSIFILKKRTLYLRTIALCVTWFKEREGLCGFEGLSRDSKIEFELLNWVVDDGNREGAGEGGICTVLRASSFPFVCAPTVRLFVARVASIPLTCVWQNFRYAATWVQRTPRNSPISSQHP